MAKYRLTENNLRNMISKAVKNTLNEARKSKDPMQQWFKDFNNTSKYREQMDYIEKGGKEPNQHRKNVDKALGKKEDTNESKLRNMIRESVAEIMEGLGWDTFKGSIKDVLKGDCVDPTKDEYKNFIKSGNAYNFDYDYYNPDNENQGTNNPTNWEGKPNKRINKGLRGQAGRAVAGAALLGANKLGKAWRKWGENVEDADSKPNPTYTGESTQHNGNNLNESASGGLIEKWNYWCANYDYDFIEKAWADNKNMAQHLRSKFDAYYDSVGSYGVMLKFYLNLDSRNREILEDYVMTNYKG